MGGYATTLDVQCPHPGCGYDGPAPLIQVGETEYFLEHFTVICPWCSRGWVVDALLGKPVSADDITRISSDGP